MTILIPISPSCFTAQSLNCYRSACTERAVVAVLVYRMQCANSAVVEGHDDARGVHFESKGEKRNGQ